MMQILQTLWPLLLAAVAGFALNVFLSKKQREALQQQLQQMEVVIVLHFQK